MNIALPTCVSWNQEPGPPRSFSGNATDHLQQQKPGKSLAIWVCLKMVGTPKANGFADHYPVFKWLFHWED